MTNTAAPTYERAVEIFGHTFGWRVVPQAMNGLDGWVVRTETGLVEAWFLSQEHACRWVDVMVGVVGGQP